MFNFFRQLQPLNLQHIAIIMDGNARFAKYKGISIQDGHLFGTKNIEKIIDHCLKIKLPYLSLYAFSSENWQRPTKEVSYLMQLLEQYLDNNLTKMLEKQVKLLISGNLNKLSPMLCAKINEAVQKTQHNQKLILNVAFSYGARQEIVDATSKIHQDISSGKIDINHLNEDLFASYLYQPQLPDPDLLIRTAGDLRISNFMLWQIAYTELYFINKFWPSFTPSDLDKAIKNFQQRTRNYGTRKKNM